MHPGLDWLRIWNPAAEFGSCPDLCTVRPNRTKVSRVVDHNIGVFWHRYDKLTEINVGRVPGVTRDVQLTEIDRKLAEVRCVPGSG